MWSEEKRALGGNLEPVTAHRERQTKERHQRPGDSQGASPPRPWHPGSWPSLSQEEAVGTDLYVSLSHSIQLLKPPWHLLRAAFSTLLYCPAQGWRSTGYK